MKYEVQVNQEGSGVQHVIEGDTFSMMANLVVFTKGPAFVPVAAFQENRVLSIKAIE